MSPTHTSHFTPHTSHPRLVSHTSHSHLSHLSDSHTHSSRRLVPHTSHALWQVAPLVRAVSVAICTQAGALASGATCADCADRTWTKVRGGSRNGWLVVAGTRQRVCRIRVALRALVKTAASNKRAAQIHAAHLHTPQTDTITSSQQLSSITL